MKHNVHLLIVDPQNDFCDLPPLYRGINPISPAGERLEPKLPVPGAHADMMRLAQFIRAHGSLLADITVTFDTHHHVGIERPAFWQMGDGGAVPPYTQVTAEDVRAGRYVPRDAARRERALAYLDALEAQGRYALMIWPPHCEVGTWGHNVHADVGAAYNQWEEERGHPVGKILKGLNPGTEHYSAVKAEVPDENDPSTGVNQGLLARFEHADVVVIAGEAGSHCVRATTEHLLEYLRPQRPPAYVLLIDCMSPVENFEVQYQDFLEDMRGCGVETMTAVAFAKSLRAHAQAEPAGA